MLTLLIPFLLLSQPYPPDPVLMKYTDNLHLIRHQLQLFDLYLRPIKREKNIKSKELAGKTGGLSPSDIKMIAEEAMKLTILDSRSNVSKADLLFAIKKFKQREKIKQATTQGDNNGTV